MGGVEISSSCGQREGVAKWSCKVAEQTEERHQLQWLESKSIPS